LFGAPVITKLQDSAARLNFPNNSFKVKTEYLNGLYIERPS